MQAGFELGHAKVNLYLHVTGRRADGYHLLDSLAVFAGVADRLDAVPAPKLRLSLCGPFAPALQPDDADNLVLRAARVLAAHRAGSVASVHLTLQKNLPVASGIGGGSADAAACLRLLGRIWPSPPIEPAALQAMAASLGADVPVCLAQRPARMLGIGDRLEAGPALPRLGIMLVNCGAAVSTQAVFGLRTAPFSAPAELPRYWPDAVSLARTLAGLSNDLQAPARQLCPPIGAVLDRLAGLQGCLLARMSGSGATCFGLFADPEAAVRARDQAGLPQGWWSWAGGLRPTDDPA